MAVVQRISTIQFNNNLGSTKTWVATADILDTAAGSSVVVTITRTNVGPLAPTDPDTFTLVYADDNSGVIKTVTLNTTSASQTDTFFFTNNGLTGGSVRAGTVEIKLRVTKTTGGPTATYDTETDNAPNNAPSTFVVSQLDRGYIRGSVIVTQETSNVAIGGVKTQPAEYDESLFVRTTLSAQLYVARVLTIGLSNATPALSTTTSSSVGPVYDVTFSDVVDNRFPAGVTSSVASLTVPNATLTGVASFLFTYGTIDSSSNNVAAGLIGTVAPLLVTSPSNYTQESSSNQYKGSFKGLTRPTLIDSPWGTAFGKSYQFDGTNNFSNSQGINFGNVGSLPTGDWSITFKWKVERINADEVWVGKWVTSSGGEGEWLIYNDGTALNKPSFYWIDSSLALQRLQILTSPSINDLLTFKVVKTATLLSLYLSTNGGNYILQNSFSNPTFRTVTTHNLGVGMSIRDTIDTALPAKGVADSLRILNQAESIVSGTTPVETSPFTNNANTTFLAQFNTSDEVVNFSNAASFDGVDRDNNSTGINCGVIGFSGTSPFTLEAKIFRNIGADQYGIFVSKFGDAAAKRNYLLYCGETVDKFNFAVVDSGGVTRFLTSTTTLIRNVVYEVAGVYDGDKIYLFVNRIKEAELVVGALQTADITTRTLIGRVDNPGTGDAQPVPFNGIIDEVRISNIARYTTNGSPTTTPYTSDANTVRLYHLDSLGADIISVDPRGTCGHLMQIDDGNFGTPPLLKNKATGQRLSTQIGYLSTNIRAARGTLIGNVITGGKNGVGIHTNFADIAGAVSAITQDETTVTRGGELGWTPFMQWTSQLPGGTWVKTVNITSPSDLTGAGYLLNTTINYTLISFNPNIVVTCYPNILIRPNNHMVAGSWVRVTAFLLDTATGLRLNPDTGTAFVIVSRYNSTSGRLEYLISDTDNTETAWVTWNEGDTATSFLLTPTGVDGRLLTRDFVNTGGWTKDIRIRVIMKFGGSPYTDFSLREVVGSKNPHDRKEFDPTEMFS